MRDDIHPNSQRLLDQLKKRKSGKLTISYRALLDGYGYLRRTEVIVDKVQHDFRALGIIADFTKDRPGFDDLIELRLAHPVAAPPPPQPVMPANSGGGIQNMVKRSLLGTVEIATETGSGSGFVVHPDGLIATNWHVVGDDFAGTSPIVVILNGEAYEGVVFAGHPIVDYALLWIIPERPLTALPLGDPQRLEHGESLTIIGAPAGLSQTVTRGIVSNPKRIDNGIEFIQTDTTINPGNSGGPALTDDGRVVGLATWKRVDMANTNFIVPIDYLFASISEALRRGKEACLEAIFCVWCGHTDYDKVTTGRCLNCGASILEDADDLDEEFVDIDDDLDN